LSVNLPYLSAVMKEVLRLFSPASLGTIRMCHKEVQVLGHKLPKASHVQLCPVEVRCGSSQAAGSTAAQHQLDGSR
jgi:cytochrome P450